MAANQRMVENAQIRTNKRSFKIDWILTLILILALFLYGWQIWKAGSANAFYTAAIKSMTESFKNFWYGSFDPAGYITVDKPPVALWFMAISAKIFGVHGWSVVLPSVLFGVGSVYLMYRLVQPYFCKSAGRLAALAMTLTPIVVADSRTNNMDAILIFFLLLALLMLEKAIASQKLVTLLTSFALIGIAFNVKMLQAFMILPAMYLFYWLAANETWKKKVTKLAFATISLLVFTLALPISTDMTSASKRPYIGGSETNSLMELAFGYNGTERLLGQTTGTGGTFGGGMNSKTQTKKGGGPQGGKLPTNMKKGNAKAPGKVGGKTAQGMPGGQNQKGGPGKMGNGGGGGGAFDIGTIGPFRLFQSSLGPQISWLLPFAIIGLVGGLVFFRDRKRKWYALSREQKQLILWTGWLVPVYGFFSVASFFHPYYMIMLAPPIAALFGIGVTALVKLFNQGRRNRWQFYLLPVALIATAALQSWYVYSYYPWLTWLILAVAIGISAGLVLLPHRTITQPLIIGGLLGILVAPAWWSLTPTIAAESAMIPTAGPSLLTSGQGGSAMGGGMGNNQVNSKLLNYLEKNQGNAKYLFATSDSTTAAPYIIKTGKAVMAMGGFNGTDPAITLKEFKKLVKTGQLKYFYYSGKSGNTEIINWIKKHATKVKTSLYQNTSSQAVGTSSSQTSSQKQPSFNGKTKPTGTKKRGAMTPPSGGKRGAGMSATKKPGTKSKATTPTRQTKQGNAQQPGGMGMGGMGSTGVLYDLSTIYK